MNLTLIAAAVIPAIWLLIKVYRADRLEKEPVRPFEQEKYSFYPQFDDHISTFGEEYARMPEGYPITLGGKHTDY